MGAVFVVLAAEVTAAAVTDVVFVSVTVSEVKAVVSAAVSVPVSAPKAEKQVVTDESIIVKAQAMPAILFFILFILLILLTLFLLEKECEDRCHC